MFNRTKSKKEKEIEKINNIFLKENLLGKGTSHKIK